MGVKVKFHKGAWWVFIHHKGRRKSKAVGDRETALRVAKRIREQLALGEFHLKDHPVQAPIQTLNAYADSWLSGVASTLKASTLRFYAANLTRHVRPSLGLRPITSLTRADCRELIATSRGKGLKVNTVRGIARTLSALLSQAVEDDKLSANPALRMGRYLRRGDEPKLLIQPLTRAEAAHLVGVARLAFTRWYAWVLLALRTGLRLGEQIGLQWGDIDWNGQFLVVQRNIVRGVVTTPKSHQCRRVDLSAQLIAALLAWRRVQQARWLKKGKEMPPWVFPSLEGTPLEERNVRHVFNRMLDAAKLRHLRIHDLRHTFASLLLQQGESVVYVKEQLGHGSIQITVDTYGHLIPGANRGAVNRLDDADATHSNASQAQPEAFVDEIDEHDDADLLRKSGEPPRNRTENPQIKSLLLCQLS
jgi:integrase